MPAYVRPVQQLQLSVEAQYCSQAASTLCCGASKHVLCTPSAVACPTDTVMFLNPAKEYLKALDPELPYYLVSPWAHACRSAAMCQPLC